MLLARVRRTVRERGLLARGEFVLAAISGGADSMALMNVLARLDGEIGVRVEVASVDHGLRSEAAAEVELVRQESERLDLRFHALRVAVAPGASLQAAARTARYEALQALRATRGANAIVTGHTLDDQAETVLARLLRGAGPTGLAAIDPRRADGVRRPLLDATRRETRAWCVEHDIPFVDDPSNRDERFQRVRIRHRVLPLLRHEDTQIDQHLAQLADDLRAMSELVRQLADELLREATSEDAHALRAEPLMAAAKPVRLETLRIWAERLTANPLRRTHLQAMDDALFSKGEALLTDLWMVGRDGECLRALRDPGHRLARRYPEREEA